jgi:hypothetical protein
MRATSRAAALAFVAVLATGAAPAGVASAHNGDPARNVARLALSRLIAGGAVAGRRVDVDHLVRATVCFDGACVHRRVRPDPVCDPTEGACIGTALRAWRRNHFAVEVELA